MIDLLQFKVELKEFMTGALKKIQGTSREVFTGVDRDIAGTQRGLTALGGETRLRVDTSGLRGAKAEVEGLGEAMKGLSELKIVGGMAGGELLARGIERGFDFAKEQIKDVFVEGMGASKTEAQIKVMAGDGPGEELYKQTHAYIPTSMFGPELFEQEKALLGMGEASKNILTDIKQIGDIGMADAGHMQSIELALGETIATGNFSMMQQRILRPTGFNPLVELSRVTGKSMEYYQDVVSKGEFTTQMFRDAMVAATTEGGRFYEMQKKMAETPFGKMKIMSTNIARAKEEMGVAMLPMVAEVMDAMKPLVDELPDALEKLRPSIEGLGHDFADLLKWTANNTETIGKFFGIVKVGVEGFLLWKAATLALATANMILGAGIGTTAVATTGLGAATIVTDEELLAEKELVGALAIEYDALAVSISDTVAEYKVLNAQNVAARSMSLPINMGGVGLGAAQTAGNATRGLSGGLIGAATSVFVVGMAAELLASMMDKDPYSDRGWDLKRIFGAGLVGSSENMAFGASLLKTFGYDPIGDGLYSMKKTKEFSTGIMGWANYDGRYPGMPGAMGGDGKPGKPTPTPGDSSDSIVGGGRRVININYNAPLYKVEHQVLQHVKDVVNDLEGPVREALLKTLASVPGFLGN